MIHQSRYIFTFIFLLTLNLQLFAGEGMWVPFLLKGAIEADMQSKGLKLNAEDLYSLNKSSLKDGIVHFGGGCTGAMVSEKGLLFTNHHCGFSQIQSHSTVENDLVTKGFWAKTLAEELPNSGLIATFIIRIEDVSREVFEGTSDTMNIADKEKIIAGNSKKIEAAAIKDTHYSSFIKSFYSGNAYYLYVVEIFKDVRLVGAPPVSIGKFGSATDNWVWPKHTADFALFRIYAGTDNKPASYSKDNIPYVPKHVFPINIQGTQENDFTMVYGFPGTTKEYLTSDGVELIAAHSNPVKIQLRNERLDIWNRKMSANDTIRIAYSAKESSLSNYHKKWIGEINGIKKMNAVQIKRDREQEFEAWVNSDPSRIAKYGNLLAKFSEVYSEMPDLQIASDHYGEAILAIELLYLARSFTTLAEKSAIKSNTIDSLKPEIERLKKTSSAYYNNFNLQTDKEVASRMIYYYNSVVLPKYQNPYFKTQVIKYKGNTDKLSNDIFEKSIFSNEKVLLDFLDSYKPADLNKLLQDPAFKLITEVTAFHRKEISPNLKLQNLKLDSLYGIYMKAILEKDPTKIIYPDANSTLRITYGKIEGYEPYDGAIYKSYSTLDGLIAKNKMGTKDYEIPEKLIELWQKKDYGNYAQNKELRVNFIASNHTTGGNSGSPVLNASGEIIGLNYDRNWEGTMSEIIYDKNMVRNISVDIRFALFIIDKFAEANYLLDEMKIIK